jgi:hypothetical protein
MTLLARLISWLNEGTSALFGVLRGPMTALPAWLSLTVISALLGAVLLILFKYTSPQTAISRVRDKIKAHLLAMKLFKDNIPVVLKSQVQVFAAAVMLLIYSIPPMLVMILPFCLVLGQLGVWYQARPLAASEQAVVVMQLADSKSEAMPSVSLVETGAVKIVAGPVRVPSRRQIYWQIQPARAGIHQVQFTVGQTQVQKELSVGSGHMPVSIKRPSLDIADLILYPAEKPFNRTSPVRWIRIDYPQRTAPLTGSGVWVVTLFVISMLAALIVKPFFNVKI